MRKTILSIVLAALLLAASPAIAVGPPGSGSGTGVLTDTNCNQAKYFAIGILCQDTDDGKLYKGTGAAVTEITAGVGIAADGSVPMAGVLLPDGDNTRNLGAAGTKWATVYATTFSGALSGNATTATALAANPADCAAGQLATGIAANGDLTCSATPSLQALNLTGTNSLGLGTASSATGLINFKNSANANELILQAGETAAAITYTLPAAAPSVNGQIMTATTAGAMSWSGTPSITSMNLVGANSLGLGTAGSNVGSISFKNATSGSIVLQPATGALGSSVLSLPALTGTLATTDLKPTDLAIASQAAGDIIYFNGTNWVRLAKDEGKFLKSGASAVSWDTPTGAAHDAVTLAASATPILGLSTQELSFDTQTANYVLAGPTTGAAAAPTFRALVAADIPIPTAITVADSTDTTTFVALFEDATGDLGPKTDAGITYNASTGMLSVTGLTTGSGGITQAASSAPTSTFLDSDAPGTDKEIAKIVGGYVDGADGSENGTLDLYVHEAGSSTSYIQLDGKNTQVEINKTLALGANSITMSGSIGVTGTRVTKGWFTDIESTNMPTVGGTAILTSLTAPQFTTIELGHASDTTIARVSAGKISVEGVNVVTTSSTDTLTNKTLTAPVITIPQYLIDCNGSEDPYAWCTSANAATLTAAMLSGGVINSYGRGEAQTDTLPAAAAGLNAIFIVGTQHNSAWKIQRAGSDVIYVDKGDGTLLASKTYFQETNMPVGCQVECHTFQTGASAYTWRCQAASSKSCTWVTD